MGNVMKGKLPERRTMKEKKRILSLLLSLLLITALLLTPAGAHGFDTELLSVTQSTITDDYLGPVTPKDVIYQIITDRFYDGDPTNNIPAGFDPDLFDGTGTDIRLYQGGDWQGIIDKIPYLKSMGITAVWISAPYANRDQATHDGWTSYHGYHARNYFTTNKHFGTMAEFDELQQELTDAGIKLVIDFVTNHSSDSRYDGKIYEPDRNSAGEFVFDAAGEPVDYNNDGTTENLVADPNNDTNGWFHHLGDRGTDNSTFGYRFKELAYLADYSQENAAVAEYMEDALIFWAEKGISGIRHDATLHMNPAFVKNAKDAVDSENAPITHFGEFFIGRPDSKYSEYASFPDRTGVTNLDFEFYNSVNQTFGNFSQSMTDFANMLEYTDDDYTYENQFVTFIDNHDVTRFRYVQSNDKPFHAAIAALLTCRGTPNIYYGTEQYLSAPDSGAGRIYMGAVSDFESTTATQLIKALSDLRQENDALAYGTTDILYSSNDVVVYSRQFYSKQVIVAINRQPDQSFTVPALNTTLPNGTYNDVLNGLLYGESATVSSGSLQSFTLGGGEVCVWSYNPDLGTDTPRIGNVISTMGRAGNTVYIYGTGLGGTPTVKFGDATATVVSASDEMIEAIVPANAAVGENTITVTKGSSVSNGFTYTVLSGDPNQVIFHVNANTNYGETIHVVGSIPELGSWDTDKCTEAMMCPNYPEWFLHVSVPADTTFSFKFIKKDANGNVTWESCENRVITSSSSPAGTIDTPVYTWGVNYT